MKFVSNVVILAAATISSASALMQAEPRPDSYTSYSTTYGKYETYGGNYQDPMYHGRNIADPGMAYSMPGSRTAMNGARTDFLPQPKAYTGLGDFKTAGYDTYEYADPAFCRTMPGRIDPSTQTVRGERPYLPKPRVVTGIEGYNPYDNTNPDPTWARSLPYSR